MAINKIDKVRTSGEARHHMKRMKPKKAKDQMEAKKELDQIIHLITASSASQAEPLCILPKIKVVAFHQQYENRLMEE